jgi:hypothetical protein
VEKALEAARPLADATAGDAARKALSAVVQDGSRGVHNFELAKLLLEDALHRLRLE